MSEELPTIEDMCFKEALDQMRSAARSASELAIAMVQEEVAMGGDRGVCIIREGNSIRTEYDPAVPSGYVAEVRYNLN